MLPANLAFLSAHDSAGADVGRCFFFVFLQRKDNDDDNEKTTKTLANDQLVR